MDRAELQSLVSRTWSEATLVERHPVLRRLRARPGIPVKTAQAALELNEDTDKVESIPADSPDGFLVVPFFRDTAEEGLQITGLEFYEPGDDDYNYRLGSFEGTSALAYPSTTSSDQVLACSSWREAVSVNAMTGCTAIAAGEEEDLVKLAAARKKPPIVVLPSDDERLRREARRAGIATVEPPEDHGTWEELIRHRGLDEAAELFNEKLEQAIEDLRNAIPIYRSDELPQGDDKAHLWEGVIPQNSFGVLFGQPGTGKSFSALGLALSVASGQDFLGRRTTPGGAVYIAAEGGEDVRRRIEAWQLENGVQGELPLAVVPKAVMLDQSGAKERLAEAIETILDEPPRLLVVDTLARCFGGDENRAADMAKFIAALDWLKNRFPGLATLIVHHSGKADNSDMRGSSALLGAVDMAAAMMAQQGRPSAAGLRLVLRSIKQKDLEPHGDIELMLSQVPLSGLDAYGRPRSSCVLRLQDGGRKDQPSAGAQSVLEALRAAPSDNEGGVRLADWRAAFYAAAEDLGRDAQRKAFGRGKKDLLESGFVWQDGKLFYLKNDTSTL